MRKFEDDYLNELLQNSCYSLIPFFPFISSHILELTKSGNLKTAGFSPLIKGKEWKGYLRSHKRKIKNLSGQFRLYQLICHSPFPVFALGQQFCHYPSLKHININQVPSLLQTPPPPQHSMSLSETICQESRVFSSNSFSPLFFYLSLSFYVPLNI